MHVSIVTSTRNIKIGKMEFCGSACTSGVPSFITFDKTMKMPRAKMFWVGFRIFFVSVKDLKKKEPNQRMKFPRKSWKVLGREIKSNGAVSENVVRLAISARSP